MAASAKSTFLLEHLTNQTSSPEAAFDREEAQETSTLCVNLPVNRRTLQTVARSVAEAPRTGPPELRATAGVGAEEQPEGANTTGHRGATRRGRGRQPASHRTEPRLRKPEQAS